MSIFSKVFRGVAGVVTGNPALAASAFYSINPNKAQKKALKQQRKATKKATKVARKQAKKAAKTGIQSLAPVLTSPVGFDSFTEASTGAMQMSLLPAIASGGRAVVSKLPAVLPGVGEILGTKTLGKVLTSPGVQGAIGGIVGGAIGEAVFDGGGGAAGAPKRRKMNYCNMKAANRAVRRICGARNALRKIEQSLPTRGKTRPGGCTKRKKTCR